MTDTKVLLLVCVMVAVTAALRFLPFLIFGNRETPKYIMFLGKVLPCAIMGMLVVYCLKALSFSDFENWLPYLISVSVVVLLHIWKRNTLLSIISGTVSFMLLVQFVFVP